MGSINLNDQQIFASEEVTIPRVDREIEVLLHLADDKEFT